MKAQRLLSILLAALLIAILALHGEAAEPRQYEATWESLSQYEVPQWYEDAKFGIFIHWGPYAVPAFASEWYPRQMYQEGVKGGKYKEVFEHHKNTWGNQKEFGYKDFLPLFKAEKFDADQWAELFQKAGAKYVVPVAEHHDSFAMYNSSVTPFNSVKTGPRRDVLGELGRAVRKRGMKLGASSHYAFNYDYYKKDEKFDTVDPRYEDLYGPIHEAGAPVTKAFMDKWYARTVDIIDHYRPAVLWFDFGFNDPQYEPYRKKLGAYYYNKALTWGDEGALNYKWGAYPDGTAVLDLERSKLAEIRDMFWQTDTSISLKSWGYIDGDEFKSVNTLVDDLVDIVSKNGCMLLNVGPKADGTIPDGAKEILLGIGRWLKLNGEAVYGTRPWQIFGEGPTGIPKAFREVEQGAYTGEDIRFTAKGDCLYAIALDWPEGPLTIGSLGSDHFISTGGIAEVSLVGSGPLEWSRDAGGLTVQFPKKKPCENAYVIKIKLEGAVPGRLRYELVGDHEVELMSTVTSGDSRSVAVPFALVVNGQTVDTDIVYLAPGEVKEVSGIHTLPGDGVYQVTVSHEGRRMQPVSFVAPTVPLEGTWRFKKGDDMAWKDPGLDDADWQVVELPCSWEAHSGYTDDEVYGWYRKKILIPAGWQAHADTLTFTLGMHGKVSETYLNGESIGTRGSFPPKFKTGSWHEVSSYTIAADKIRFGQPNTIAVRVYDHISGDRYSRNLGGILNGPLGPVTARYK